VEGGAGAAVEWGFAFFVALVRKIRLNARWHRGLIKGE
jgi:hypothetical protein